VGLTDDAALLIGSDFGHPDERGERRKTMLVRTIKVTRG
jgi:hypothetical protein